MISQNEYLARRNALAHQLPDNSVVIIAAASEKIRNGDAHYHYRQDSNFYYLTGFNEPEAILIIKKTETITCYLFNRSHDLLAEQWTGKRMGQDEACNLMKLEDAFAIETLTNQLPILLTDVKAVYFPFAAEFDYQQLVSQAIDVIKKQVRRGLAAPQSLVDVDPLLSELRLFKSKAEIALMQKAADISIAAHKQAMRACKNLQFEYQLQAELLQGFYAGGCNDVAYSPIVGSGKNACVLHYIENQQKLNKGDLVLIDAGGEYQYYASDITRTFPINGKFSEQQAALYQIVLAAQREAIASIKPGSSWIKAQQIILRVLTDGLVSLGILQGDVEQLIAAEAYKPFYMHSSGHWLGLDVHDCGQYKINNEWRPLEAGMVLTVEPGLYISEQASVDPCWWNIGIRIEDDVVVTSSGHLILTKDLPVEIADIEALMRA